MPKIIITHAVADVANWLKPEHKDERHSAIRQMGGSGVRDHVAQDGSNSIALSADIAEVDALLAALASPPDALKALMDKHGVLPPFAVYIEK
jgi:hypothetical protein